MDTSMEHKEATVRRQMEIMLADQFYHQPGKVIQIAREELINLLTKQTLHGIEIGGGTYDSQKYYGDLD